MTQQVSNSGRRARRRFIQLAALSAVASATRASNTKERSMRRVFITGSTEGLGRAAAETLINAGHQVVLHARSPQRATALADLAPRAAGVAIVEVTRISNPPAHHSAVLRVNSLIHSRACRSSTAENRRPRSIRNQETGIGNQ